MLMVCLYYYNNKARTDPCGIPALLITIHSKVQLHTVTFIYSYFSYSSTYLREFAKAELLPILLQ